MAHRLYVVASLPNTCNYKGVAEIFWDKETIFEIFKNTVFEPPEVIFKMSLFQIKEPLHVLSNIMQTCETN